MNINEVIKTILAVIRSIRRYSFQDKQTGRFIISSA